MSYSVIIVLSYKNIEIRETKQMRNNFKKDLKIAFVSINNASACQMAKGLFKDIADADYTIYSAGIKDIGSINSNAITVMNEINIDISNQELMIIEDLPREVDLLIAIDCEFDLSSYISYHYKEDWVITDPTGDDIDEYRKVRDIMKEKCQTIKKRVLMRQIIIKEEEKKVEVEEEEEIDDGTPVIYGSIIEKRKEVEIPQAASASEYDELIEKINREANFPLAIFLGILFGFLGALAWAFVSNTTGYNIGIIAVLIGFIVSQGFIIAGRSTKIWMGLIAAIIAFISILLGNLIIAFISIAKYLDMGFFELVQSFNYEDYFVNLIVKMHTPVSIFFYIISMTTAFKRSYIDKNKLDITITPDKQSYIDNTKE